jgi:hypothetical protein
MAEGKLREVRSARENNLWTDPQKPVREPGWALIWLQTMAESRRWSNHPKHRRPVGDLPWNQSVPFLKCGQGVSAWENS